MKKIFTLLFTTAMLTSAFAQYGSKNDRDYNDKKDVVVINDDNYKFDKGDNKFNGGKYYFTARERDMQIAKINREYDYKVQAVKSKFMMSWFQKKRQIDFLQDQRKKEISMVFAKFNDRRNQFNDHGRDKKKHW